MNRSDHFFVISDYNNDISWVPEVAADYIIYDKSEVPCSDPSIDPTKIVRSPNIGYNLYDYFTYVIDNYDTLPNVVVFAKGNVFPRHIRRERFESLVSADTFTPIESPEGFSEKNDSWYLNHHESRYFHSYDEFMRFCFKDPAIPAQIRFAPGANYVVPKENILKLPKQFYENLRSFVSYAQLPGEAHIIERALYTLWTAGFTVHENMLRPFDGKSRQAPLARTIERKLRTAKKRGEHALRTVKARVTGIKDALTPELNADASVSKEEHLEQRKRAHVYDAFTFFNELELLELRLSILDEHVDTFVIVECGETFSGKPKPLYYEENKERFARFAHKIRHYVVTGVPKDRADLERRLLDPSLDPLEREICTLALTSDNVPKDSVHWLKEFYQKESIRKALVGAKDEDVVYVSDLDEIWNPETLIDYRWTDIFKLRQLVYAYYLNNRSSEPWAGTLMTRYENIRNACLNHLRTKRKTKYSYIKDGGWHFTNIGGADRIRAKLESYGHQEFNTEEIKAKIEAQISGNKDFIGRHFTFWTDESDLPHYLKGHKEHYRRFFK